MDIALSVVSVGADCKVMRVINDPGLELAQESILSHCGHANDHQRILCFHGNPIQVCSLASEKSAILGNATGNFKLQWRVPWHRLFGWNVLQRPACSPIRVVNTNVRARKSVSVPNL